MEIGKTGGFFGLGTGPIIDPCLPDPKSDFFFPVNQLIKKILALPAGDSVFAPSLVAASPSGLEVPSMFGVKWT